MVHPSSTDQHMCGLLSVTSRPLAFVVVLTLSPALSPAATKRLLQHNPHLCYRVVVRAGEHGFCLGSQHCQPRRHEREDRHDTVVLFLLSKGERDRPASDFAVESAAATIRPSQAGACCRGLLLLGGAAVR